MGPAVLEAVPLAEGAYLDQALIGVLFDNGRSVREAQVRIANLTGTGDVRLSGTPTG